MRDEELIEQAMNLPLIYCDALGAYRKVNGLLRCVGYVIQGGATLNLAVSLTGADQAQIDTHRTLHERPARSALVWNGADLQH